MASIFDLWKAVSDETNQRTALIYIEVKGSVLEISSPETNESNMTAVAERVLARFDHTPQSFVAASEKIAGAPIDSIGITTTGFDEYSAVVYYGDDPIHKDYAKTWINPTSKTFDTENTFAIKVIEDALDLH